MLKDRQEGWSLASLAHKYNVKSNRSIVYLCQKNNVYPPLKPKVIYYTIAPDLAIIFRHTVKHFSIQQQFEPQINKKRSELLDRSNWWCVEEFVKKGNYSGKPMYSFSL